MRNKETMLSIKAQMRENENKLAALQRIIDDSYVFGCMSAFPRKSEPLPSGTTSPIEKLHKIFNQFPQNALEIVVFATARLELLNGNELIEKTRVIDKNSTAFNTELTENNLEDLTDALLATFSERVDDTGSYSSLSKEDIERHCHRLRRDFFTVATMQKITTENRQAVYDVGIQSCKNGNPLFLFLCAYATKLQGVDFEIAKEYPTYLAQGINSFKNVAPFMFGPCE